MINAPAVFGLLLTISYLIGAVSFAQLIAKFKKIDLTKVGSGNYGATNVYRALGLKYAIIVFLLDVVKGVIPTYYTLILFDSSPIIQLIVGFSAILGHTFSLFLGFRGGKGVATAIGVFIVLVPKAMVITLCFAIIILFLFRYVSLASIFGAVLLPVLVYYFNEPVSFLYAISLFSLFIIIKHRSNIRRLMTGTENKIK